MKSIDKEVAHPIAVSPFRVYLRTLAGVFMVRLKTAIKDYLQSAVILLASMVILFAGMTLVSRADFLKDDGWMGSAKATAVTAPKTSAAATSPIKTLASSGTGSTATYTYDNEGARATKTENGKTTYYVNKYYEEDSDGTVRKFIWAGDLKVATVESIKGSSAPEKVTYHHSDHLGGSNVSTDSAGSVAEVNDYYPYGKSRIEERTGTYSNNYLYTGKELDRSTGLYYYGARYYDPLTGRFTSVDPWQGDITNPQSLNSYSYVTNNPMRYTDPTGMWGVLPGLGGKSHQRLTNIALNSANVNEEWIKEHSGQLIYGASIYADIVVKLTKGEKNDSYHSTTSKDITSAIDLKNKMMGHAERFFNDKSDKEFGRLLHMVQDSYCPSHVERDANGKIKAFLDYSKQSKLKHTEGDDMENASLDSLVGAIGATKKLIEYRANPDTKWENVKSYLDTEVWQLRDDTTIGTAGEEYKKD